MIFKEWLPRLSALIPITVTMFKLPFLYGSILKSSFSANDIYINLSVGEANNKHYPKYILNKLTKYH